MYTYEISIEKSKRGRNKARYAVVVVKKLLGLFTTEVTAVRKYRKRAGANRRARYERHAAYLGSWRYRWNAIKNYVLWRCGMA